MNFEPNQKQREKKETGHINNYKGSAKQPTSSWETKAIAFYWCSTDYKINKECYKELDSLKVSLRNLIYCSGRIQNGVLLASYRYEFVATSPDDSRQKLTITNIKTTIVAAV